VREKRRKSSIANELYLRELFRTTRMGYDGRECILRALCESPQLFGKRGSHLIAEVLRTVFSFPKSKVLPFENQALQIYNEAFKSGRAGQVACQKMFPNCGFSLIKLALGKYVNPLEKYM